MTTHPFYSVDNIRRLAQAIEAEVRARTHVDTFRYVPGPTLARAMMRIAQDRPAWLHTASVQDNTARLNRLTVEREVDRLTEFAAAGAYVGDGYAPNTGPTNGGSVGNQGRIQGSQRLFIQREKVRRDADHAVNGAHYTFGANHMARHHRDFRRHQAGVTAQGMTGGLVDRFDMVMPAFERQRQHALRAEFGRK